MTHLIRETSKFKFFQEIWNNYTAVIRLNDLEITNWNTGSEATEEKEYLSCCTEQEFNEYCEQLFI